MSATTKLNPGTELEHAGKVRDVCQAGNQASQSKPSRTDADEIRVLRDALKSISQLGSYYETYPDFVVIARRALGCATTPKDCCIHGKRDCELCAANALLADCREQLTSAKEAQIALLFKANAMADALENVCVVWSPGGYSGEQARAALAAYRSGK